MIRQLLTAAVVAFAIGLPNLASAGLITATLLDADFTQPTYTDGIANTQPGFNGNLTQTNFVISDSAGTGLLSNDGFFTRAQFGPGSGGQAVVAGDMILVESFGFTATGTNDSRAVLGLSDGGTGGTAGLAIGTQLSVDGTGNVFVENSAFGVDNAGRVDTGFDVGTAFDWGVRFTAEAAGSIEAVTYTVEHLINGATVLTETGQGIAPQDPVAANFLSGFIQDQGNGATISTSRLRLSTIGVAVPEPGTLGLLAVGGAFALVRRRR